MKERNYILLFIVFVLPFIAFAQDGQSLILIHNYPDKTAIDAITNPSDGNIVYNATGQSFYLYDEDNSKWIADCYYKAITTTTGALTLDESHYTVIIEADTHTITLPATADYNGREYVLKNTTAGSVTITDYLDNSGTTVTTIPSYNTLKIQSDGFTWHQVNNYQVACSSTANSTTGTSTGTEVNDFTTTWLAHLVHNTGFSQIQFDVQTAANSWEVHISDVNYSGINFNNGQNFNGGDTVPFSVNSTQDTISGLWTHVVSSSYAISPGDDINITGTGVTGGTAEPDDCCITFFIIN